MNPNDLDKNGFWPSVSGNSQKIIITDLVRQANKKLKETLIGGELEVEGVTVKLLASKTGFGGERLWFECPRCKRRSGVLYRSLNRLVMCRLCID